MLTLHVNVVQTVLLKMWDSVEFMKDDPLHLVLLMIRNLFENKIFKIIQYFVFFLHLTLSFLTMYFFIKNRDLDFTTQYIAHSLGTFAAVIFNFMQLLEGSSVMKLRDEVFKLFWSFDCAPKELRDKLLKEAGYLKMYVIVNTSVAVITGFIMYPVGIEEDYHFPLYLSRTYFPDFYFELKMIYVLTFPVISLTMIYLSNVMVYLTFHAKSQVLLLYEDVKNITSDYRDFEDDTLYHDEEYQSEVTKRLNFIIKRHIELMGQAKSGNDLASKFIPMLSLGGTLMGVSIMCYWYLGLIFGKWCYVQMTFWIFTASLTGLIFPVCGQEMEDVSLSAVDLLYDMRWITWNKTNKKSLQILMMRASEPFQLKFLQNYVINYDFGVRMAKLLYSFAAVISRFRDYNLAKY